jgi:hypothetical protein
MTWDAGTSYPAQLTVTDASGAPVTPATVTLTITQPDQTAQMITQPGGAGPLFFSPWPPTITGTVVYNFAAAQPGLHQFDWSATGPVVRKTDYENFRKFASAISLQDARSRIGLTSTVNDERLRLLMGAATREVEKIVGTLVPRVFTDDWIPGTYRDVLRLPHGPALSNTAVTSLKSAYPAGPNWDVSQLLVNPYPGTIRHTGLLPFWYGPWLVSYTAGVTEVPEPVAEGIRETVFDLYAQMRGLSADVAEAAAEESLTVPPYYRLPARALAAIKGYEMPGFG